MLLTVHAATKPQKSASIIAVPDQPATPISNIANHVPKISPAAACPEPIRQLRSLNRRLTENPLAIKGKRYKSTGDQPIKAQFRQ
jgi:hypothetical protein